MELEQLDLIKALIKLSGKTARQIAEACAVSESNFSAFMRDVRPFPEAKQPLLMLALGIDGHGLLKQTPHVWYVSQDLSPLQMAVKHLFPRGAEIEGLWRAGGGVWDIRRTFDNVLFAVSDGTSRIVINRSGIGFFMALDPSPITPDTVPGFKWQAVKPSADTMIQIAEDRYAAWVKAEISNDEFDAAFLGKSNAVTWQQIQEYALGCGMTTNEVLQVLMTRQGAGK
jgi:transcriptional regulator with XRE-family HTH domain